MQRICSQRDSKFTCHYVDDETMFTMAFGSDLRAIDNMRLYSALASANIC
jgi:hypothetical protein